MNNNNTRMYAPQDHIYVQRRDVQDDFPRPGETNENEHRSVHPTVALRRNDKPYTHSKPDAQQHNYTKNRDPFSTMLTTKNVENVSVLQEPHPKAEYHDASNLITSTLQYHHNIPPSVSMLSSRSSQGMYADSFETSKFQHNAFHPETTSPL